MQDTTASAILLRLKNALAAKSDSELGRLLGVSQQAVSNAKNNYKLPDSWVRIAAERHNLCMDWIVFGRGPMCPGDDSGGEAAAAAGKGPSSSQCPHCATLEAELRAERDERRELSLENRRLWKENAELRERCARFEERAVARSAPQPGIVDQEERKGSVPDVFEERPPIPSNDVIRCPRMDK